MCILYQMADGAAQAQQWWLLQPSYSRICKERAVLQLMQAPIQSPLSYFSFVFSYITSTSASAAPMSGARRFVRCRLGFVGAPPRPVPANDCDRGKWKCTAASLWRPAFNLCVNETRGPVKEYHCFWERSKPSCYFTVTARYKCYRTG